MSEASDLPTFSVDAQGESATKTTVETRGFELTIDEPEDMGGTDDGPNPLEYLIAAHAGCLNATAHEVADDMGIEVADLNIGIDGAFNPAKFQGESTDDRAGYQDIDVTIEADTDADDDTVDEWIEGVEERCPVTDNIANATAIDVSVSNR